MRSRATALGCLALAVLLLPACSEPLTPEEQVAATVERAVSAAGDRDLDALLDVVAEDYEDGRGNSRREIEGIVRYYVLQSRSLHLLHRVKSIGFDDPSRAEVLMLVALAARPLEDGADLEGISADLLHLELTLRHDGGDRWVVASADWRSAELSDFL